MSISIDNLVEGAWGNQKQVYIERGKRKRGKRGGGHDSIRVSQSQEHHIIHTIDYFHKVRTWTGLDTVVLLVKEYSSPPIVQKPDMEEFNLRMDFAIWHYR